MLRAGMYELVEELRGMTNTGESDYTINSVAYWTDDQLQTVLDRSRLEVVAEALTMLDEQVNGAPSTTRYYSRYGNYEQGASFVVADGLGVAAGTALYTADYARGEIVFASDTGGAAYYLTGRSYDLNSAAAEVWERKAAQSVSAAFTWSSDNMRVDKSGLRREAVEMARYYRGLAGPKSISMERSDT